MICIIVANTPNKNQQLLFLWYLYIKRKMKSRSRVQIQNEPVIFHFLLMSLGKAWISLFTLPMLVTVEIYGPLNSRFGRATRLEERKTWIHNLKTRHDRIRSITLDVLKLWERPEIQSELRKSLIGWNRRCMGYATWFHYEEMGNFIDMVTGSITRLVNICKYDIFFSKV